MWKQLLLFDMQTLPEEETALSSFISNCDSSALKAITKLDNGSGNGPYGGENIVKEGVGLWTAQRKLCDTLTKDVKMSRDDGEHEALCREGPTDG